MPEVKGLKTLPPPRWKQYHTAKGKMPPMPQVVYGEHLLGFLFEFGPTEEGRPVSFQEIESWARTAVRRVDGWEVLTLRMMSEAYARQAQKAKSPDCPSPLEEGKETAEQISKKAVEKFRSLNSGRRKKRGGRG